MATSDGCTPSVIIAYYGVDGACAAAAALLARRDAELIISSARRIGRTLAALAEREACPSEVHVCGLGVHCDWRQVAEPAEHLRRGGARITWYCGRGYLDERRDAFDGVCTPVFTDVRSNAEAVCEHLGLRDGADARRLMALALRDPRIGPPRRAPSEEDRFWLDLIEATVAQYLKYQDPQAYADAIAKLAAGWYEESDRLQVDVFRRFGLRHMLQGKSAVLDRLRETIGRCALVDEAVLITGESGVGKEYVAHLIHEGSARAMEPMTPVNCALFAGNAGLANSVLFGHRKGAFTGAAKDRDGAFVAADGGTLFLDEVGELPAAVQAKFLRVLEDGWVTPEGADKPVRQVDVRIIAATNRDLACAIRAGQFRADLYHRLDTLRIDVPPLREHIEDLRPIVAGVGDLAEQDIGRLESYDWPGNVRQLFKVLRRAACLDMSVADAIEQERRLGALTPVEVGEGGERSLLPNVADDLRPLRDVQRDYALRALELCDGVYAAAARRLDIAINTLRSYAKRA